MPVLASPVGSCPTSRRAARSRGEVSSVPCAHPGLGSGRTCPRTAFIRYSQFPPFFSASLLSSHGCGVHAAPLQKYYYFGVQQRVKELWADPHFRALRAAHRDESAEGFFGSALAKHVDQTVSEDESLQHLLPAEKFKRKLACHANSPYEIGLDFGQPFVTKSYSLGVLGLR